MPFCRNCGTEHGEDANFCIKCGERFSDNNIRIAPKRETDVNKNTAGEVLYFIYPLIFFFLLLTQSFFSLNYSKDKGYDKVYNVLNYFIDEEDLEEANINKNKSFTYASLLTSIDFNNDKSDKSHNIDQRKNNGSDKAIYTIFIISYFVGIVWIIIVLIDTIQSIIWRIKTESKNHPPRHLMLYLSVFFVIQSLLLSINSRSKEITFTTTVLPYALLFVSIIGEVLCSLLTSNYAKEKDNSE